MNWIKTSERLPEYRKDVLGYFPDGNEGGDLVGMAIYDGENVRSSFPNSTSCYYTCTHWMPLPEPPKE